MKTLKRIVIVSALLFLGYVIYNDYTPSEAVSELETMVNEKIKESK